MHKIKIVSVRNARGYADGNAPQVGQIFNNEFPTERVATTYANELGRLYGIKAVVIVARQAENA